MNRCRLVIATLSALTLLGCAPQLLEYDATAPAAVLAPIGVPGIEDARPGFRQVFCSRMARAKAFAATPCSAFLHRLRDEPASEPSTPLPALRPGSLRILLVPGALSECVGASGLPFRRGAQRLRELGYQVETIPVSGRSGTEHNAVQIAEAVRKTPYRADVPLVLIGYSKGVNDALTFLVRYPGVAQRVAALVSVAGSVNGSPLADRYAGLYAAIADFSVGGCPPGDGEMVASLERPLNLRWLAANPLPRHVRYFSLGAYADQPHLARALRLLFAPDLARMEPRNDGQTLFYDQMIPGSVLLGYLNGDHWDVVIPLRERMPFLASNSADAPDFPRSELLESIVLFVDRYLATHATVTEPPNPASADNALRSTD